MWAKGPIDRSSDTDSMFRFRFDPRIVSADIKGQLQGPILFQTICTICLNCNTIADNPLFCFEFRFLYEPMVSVTVS